MAEPLAGSVAADPAIVADDDADVADRHHGLGDHLHAGEPAVEEIGAVGQGHILSAAAAAGAEEGLGILVVVVIVRLVRVIAHRRRDDLAGGERRTVVHGDDADAIDAELLFGIERFGGLGNCRTDDAHDLAALGALDGAPFARVAGAHHERLAAARALHLHLGLVGLARPLLARHRLQVGGGFHRAQRGADDHRAEPVHLRQFLLPAHQALQFLAFVLRQPIDGILADDDEQGGIDRVHAFTQDRALPAALAAAHRLVPEQEAAGVLEVVARRDPAERLARLERFAVAGIDVADLALRNGDQAHLVDAILPPPQAEMQPAAQQVGLEARLAFEGDDRAVRDGAEPRPQLLDDADVVVRDVADGQPHREQGEQHQHGKNRQPAQHGVQPVGQLGKEDRQMRHGITAWPRPDSERNGRCRARRECPFNRPLQRAAARLRG